MSFSNISCELQTVVQGGNFRGKYLKMRLWCRFVWINPILGMVAGGDVMSIGWVMAGSGM